MRRAEAGDRIHLRLPGAVEANVEANAEASATPARPSETRPGLAAESSGSEPRYEAAVILMVFGLGGLGGGVAMMGVGLDQGAFCFALFGGTCSAPGAGLFGGGILVSLVGLLAFIVGSAWLGSEAASAGERAERASPSLALQLLPWLDLEGGAAEGGLALTGRWGGEG